MKKMKKEAVFCINYDLEIALISCIACRDLAALDAGCGQKKRAGVGPALRKKKLRAHRLML